MAERIIDLRHGQTLQDEPPLQRDSPVGGRLSGKTADPSALSWTALEHEARERGQHWFLGPGVMALIFVIFGILTRSYFFVAFVALAYAVLLMYMRKPPRQLTIRVENDGVWAGRRHYPYKELKSFWIFDTHERKELSLETTHMLTPYLHIPLGAMDSDRVGSVISRYLPEEEHEESFSDQMARKFGF